MFVLVGMHVLASTRGVIVLCNAERILCSACGGIVCWCVGCVRSSRLHAASHRPPRARSPPQEKGVLITAAEDVMNAPSGMQAGLHQGFIRPAAVPGNMVRPEQPALQLSYAGHQIVIDSDF